jgi:hypothetical protein
LNDLSEKERLSVAFVREHREIIFSLGDPSGDGSH